MSTTTATTTTSAPCWKQQHEDNMRRRRTALDASSTSRADAMSSECRNRLIESIQRISQACSANKNGKLGLLLSGGVDSAALLEAAASSNVPIAAAVTVSIVDPNNPNGRPSEDELYAKEAARLYNESRSSDAIPMKHSIVRLSPKQLVEEYSRPTIQTLALWGFMDTRNSLIISAALQEASHLCLTDVIVGDNADELFGGSYDCYFDDKYKNKPEAWKQKRDGMADLPFVTAKLGVPYNTRVHQPFMDQELFVEWALSESNRTDCVAKCSVQSKFGGSYEVQNCGKLPLREAFCTVASWRRMDWIFRGSGAEQGDILVDYYKNQAGMSDEEFACQQREYLDKGIRLKSKEHLHNIRIFCDVFKGFNHPTKERYAIGDPRGCVSCCFEIGDEQFCHLCDEYPAQHPKEQAIV
ncbi:Asparagine synthase [Seminavis robusta]|uniref:Asparagine synthase n=1 Tax=Seminavis robusta TaxID=568900 RepID=A0A9N8DD60_9STRA|nr:Asparagine synthase [Seminavis robusta]|eukprot:Sro36_g022680.1 Asparagine synthase (412) ;mRNA; r:14917-16152